MKLKKGFGHVPGFTGLGSEREREREGGRGRGKSGFFSGKSAIIMFKWLNAEMNLLNVDG